MADPPRGPVDDRYSMQRDAITILHVDDEADFLDLTEIYLERANEAFEVLTETSAEAGLETLATTDVDCVVSDYDMPGRTGLDFLEAVRSDHPDLPFVLFTGKGSEEIASEAISAGVTDYLQKEPGTDQYTVLANRVENAVAQQDAEALVYRSFRAMDNSREGIALLDEDGYFIYVNQPYADIVGYDQDELLGEFWEVVYPDEQVDRIHEEILDAVPEAGRWTGETVYQRKDGSRVLVNHALAYSEEGTMICLIRDFSEADDQRQVLREERERFDLFVDAVRDYAIFMLDPDGFITSWNTGAERIKGYTEDEILGNHFSTFYTDEQRKAGLPDQFLERAREEGVAEHRGPRVRKDGSTFHADVVITAVYNEDGTLRGFGKVTEDVTEATEDQRRRAENERYRQELYRITTDTSLTDEEKLQRLLELGCDRLGVENGHVVHIDQEAGTHEIVRSVGSDLTEVGDVTDLSKTYCRKTITAEDMVAIHDAADQDLRDDPAYETWDIGCYLGGKLLVADELYGTVCFANREPRGTPFTHAEKAFVDLVARWTGHVLGRRFYTEELRENERRFDAVFEDPNILVALLEPDGRIIDVNRTAVEYLHVDREAVIGEPFWETPWFDGDERLRADVRELVDRAAAGEYVEFELDHTEAIGEDLIVSGVFRPVVDDDGSVVSIVASGRDVTTERRQEQALATSEARYESLTEDVLDTSEVGTFILDDAFEVVWVSEAVEEYFGIDRDSVVGADKATLIREEIKDIFENSDRFAQRVLRTYEDNTYTEEFECHVLPGDGRPERWLRHWSQPIESGLYEGGRIEHYTDVTDRKKRDQQLDAMDRVLRHNLHNEMNVIIGNADTIADDTDGTVARRAETIRRSGQKLLDVTKKQRDIVALLSEAPNVTSIDVTTVVRSRVHDLAERYPDTDLSHSTPDGVWARALPQFDQAVTELVENAIVHADTAAPTADVTVEPTPDTVRIRVADTGPGIPPAEQAILLGEGEGGPLYHGSGMGLWLVNWIVTYSNGSVTCRENEPRGTIVEMEVPKPVSVPWRLPSPAEDRPTRDTTDHLFRDQ